MPIPRVLVVDDDDAIRTMLQEGLQRDGCEVVAASNVSDALKHIATEKFDVLLSDLHMPLAGDGFTVVSAMRNTHPDALTVVLSGYPALAEARCQGRSKSRPPWRSKSGPEEQVEDRGLSGRRASGAEACAA